MWYLICVLVFFALEIATIAVIWRAYDIKNEITTDWGDVMEVLPILLTFTAIGALVWPLVITIGVFIVLFNVFLKDTFNKITNWLSEHM